MREAAEKRCVEVASMLPIALKGRPTFRMFIVPETPEFPQASITSYMFTLPSGQAQPTVTTIPLDKFEGGLMQGMSSLRDLRAGATVHRNLSADVVAAMSTMAYDHAQAGNRLMRVALIIRNNVACLMFMDSPADREGTYRVHWDGVIGSLRLGIATDQNNFLLRYLPVFGVALGILLVLILVFISHRRRRARDHLRPVDDIGFRGNTISDLKGSRAVDGLQIFDQEEPPPREVIEPMAAPPLAAEAPPLAGDRTPPATPEKDENALDFDIPLRKFDQANDVISGAGMAHAGPTEDRKAPTKHERKVLSASPRKSKGPAKIVRNDDYLS